MNILFDHLTWLTSKVIVFFIKHTVESEQRIQLLTKYQEIHGGKAEIYNKKIYHFLV